MSKAAKIELGKWYSAVDYEGNELPSAVAPFKKSGAFYVCVNHLGGHIHVKGNEFRPLTKADGARITSRASKELGRQMGWVTTPANVVKMGWKDEGDAGPLWFITKDGEFINYRDTDTPRISGKGFMADWFTYAAAEKIAKAANLPLEYM